jgi:hypothetical protein
VNWFIHVVLFLAPPEEVHSDGEHAAGAEGGGRHQATGAIIGFIASRSLTPSICGSTSSIDRSPIPGRNNIGELGGGTSDGGRECSS